MNDNFTNTDLLIQYLDGELEGENLQTMQRKIAADQQLAAELESLRLAKAAVNTYGLKKTISAVHKEMMQELQTAAAPPRIGMRRILQYSMRIAAMLVFILGVTILYQYFSATPDKLFRDNYDPFSLHETRGTNSNTGLENFYKKGDFAAVMDAFSKLPTPEATDYFLNGNAALQTNNTKAAIQSFLALQEKNKKNNTHFFEDDTDYYLALSYLNNNEPAQALQLLEKIHADKDHAYHNKVSGWMLRKLTRLAKQ